MSSELLAQEIYRVCCRNHDGDPETLGRCRQYIQLLCQPISEANDRESGVNQNEETQSFPMNSFTS